MNETADEMLKVLCALQCILTSIRRYELSDVALQKMLYYIH